MGGSSAAVAEHGELDRASAKTHRLSCAGRPDVYATAAHQAAGISHEILAAVSAGFESDARSQRQVTRICRDQALGYHPSTRSSAAQAVRRGDIRSRRRNVVFFVSKGLAQMTRRSLLDRN